MDSTDDPNGNLAPASGESVDPFALARRDLNKALPRSFYEGVTSGPAEKGYGIFLDGRPVRTPAKALLAVPTAALADALAEEWRGQTVHVEPDTMPMTRLANSTIDWVSAARAATIGETSKFAETDLVCYRAGDPQALIDAQCAAWDPVLAFARDALDARFVCAEGLMYVAQPEAARLAVRRAVDEVAEGAAGAFRLAALSLMTSLTGSVLLALAVARGAMSVEAAWAAAHVDEDYQIQFWGADAEATERRERRWRDMAAAARLYLLCGT